MIRKGGFHQSEPLPGLCEKYSAAFGAKGRPPAFLHSPLILL